MDQLPNEILAYIFALIILDPSENPAFVSKLGQVCSRWRALVVSTASLWSRIVLAYPMNNPQLVYAAIALERSAAHPLDILLDCRDPEWDWEEETHNFQGTHMQSILPLILPHSSRWKKIEVLSDTWAPVHAFLQATQETPLPILESASLSRCNAYFAAPGETFQPESMRSPIALFGGRSLQSLRDVSLVGVHVDWDKSALVHLRRLEFKYHSRDVMPTIHQFLRILGQCPDLLELSIVGWGPILDPKSTAVTAIELPSLQKLSFGFIDMSYSTALLSLFQLPSLRKLSLEDVLRVVTPLEDTDTSGFLQWLYTFQPTQRASFAGTLQMSSSIPLQGVQELRLQSIRSDTLTFTRFFQCFPRLQILSCHDVPDNALVALSSTIQTAGRQSNIPHLCPSLSELHFQDADPSLLMDLVAARTACEGVTPLRKVTLEYVRVPRPSPDSPTFAHLERSGISCVGGTPSGSETSDSE
ncbi:hypothetical protein CC1G_02836 [Coprinopsis cinerea okayama7|uniref:F-box domain-containing protein n=1 Tax=Coprinopsis cinerea (strain Okayama-7 / 130 / ATCC MYA-4618 / FGSC 9003) TaxID=240176 RepID=A8N067_COPC7|nr:hypothetical protein CC1G_02836 [Coprinopsis cinerea okayama7\|eukprot:XP_001828255.1 hypothetical protein CC1G_02836 [Coprinopsis cinerea okayama7\